MTVFFSVVGAYLIFAFMVWFLTRGLRSREKQKRLALAASVKRVRASCSNGEEVECAWDDAKPYIDRWVMQGFSIKVVVK